MTGPESRIRHFRRKPVTVSMIQWDGSGEAAGLIARYGGAHCDVPLSRDGDRLEIWVQQAGRYVWLEPGDWAVIGERGASPVRAWEHADLFEPVPLPFGETGPVKDCGCGPDEPCVEHAEKASPWDDDTAWAQARAAEGTLG
jgi:hypothetical protein